MSKSVDGRIEQYKRQMLVDALAQLLPAQVELFNRVYPNGIPSEKLINAIDLCERTIKKNEKGRS